MSSPAMVSCYDSQRKLWIVSKIIVVVKVSCSPWALNNASVVVVAVSFVFFSVGLKCGLVLPHTHLARECRAQSLTNRIAGLKYMTLCWHKHVVIISLVDLHELCLCASVIAMRFVWQDICIICLMYIHCFDHTSRCRATRRPVAQQFVRRIQIRHACFVSCPLSIQHALMQVHK